MIGTVGTRMAGDDVATSLTTPEAPDLHGLFARDARAGRATPAPWRSPATPWCSGRVDGVVFDVAVFVNLGRDHLDFHDTVEDYFAAKASLFTPERARRGLVNVDDEHGRRLAAETACRWPRSRPPALTADWRRERRVELRPRAARLPVLAPGGRLRRRGAAAGTFNVANALAAMAALGPPATSARSTSPPRWPPASAPCPGCPVGWSASMAGQDFEVVVDYAHKPDAVEAALGALRPLTAGRLVLVIGAGGDRDTGKRPVMGEIGARLADVLVVTDDNPRTEDPAAIRAALLAGAEQVPAERRAEVLEVAGRREAIATALRRAGPGDIVLVAGKGHETGQQVAGVVHPFDDREVARELLTGTAAR